MDAEFVNKVRIESTLDHKKNIRSYKLGETGKIEWKAHIKARKIFLCHVLSLEIPPSLLFQDAFDRLFKNETIPMLLGIDVAYTGALNDLTYYHFQINKIYRDELGHCCLEIQIADIPENPTIENCFKFLKYTIKVSNEQINLRIK